MNYKCLYDYLCNNPDTITVNQLEAMLEKQLRPFKNAHHIHDVDMEYFNINVFKCSSLNYGYYFLINNTYSFDNCFSSLSLVYDFVDTPFPRVEILFWFLSSEVMDFMSKTDLNELNAHKNHLLNLSISRFRKSGFYAEILKAVFGKVAPLPCKVKMDYLFNFSGRLRVSIKF